jgi:hypothetical protein
MSEELMRRVHSQCLARGLGQAWCELCRIAIDLYHTNVARGAILSNGEVQSSNSEQKREELNRMFQEELNSISSRIEISLENVQPTDVYRVCRQCK